VGRDGVLFAVRADGSYFATRPNNIGVESELYTRFGEVGSKDRSLERWFSKVVEDPFADILDELISLSGIQRERFKNNANKAEVVRSLGYVTSPHREFVIWSAPLRIAFANYLSALIVRHPAYLRKLRDFHGAQSDANTEAVNRELALANMHHVYNIYRKEIVDATIVLVKRHDSHEFLFSDSGIGTTEPWRQGPMPFDVHFPLTPDLAAEVFPLEFGPHPERVYVASAKNQAIARHNRVTLSGASRFVFSRTDPPIQFVKKYFGVPAPSAYGFRIIDGRLETTYDPTRDRR
jgi:hypothetical protein